ncbi:MAG: rhodanese-like domain-containing protein [Flavobacteriaceae bacterium]|jgi:rhodanese-related sulfurtransferase
MKHLFALLVLFVACAQEKPQIQLVEKETFQELMTQEVQLIDVRTPSEYEGGYIGTARNINYNATDFAEQVSKLDRDKPVLVYCAVGGRSARAAKVFESLGFKTIYDLKGGYNAW